jgi:hypothetical protein
MAMDRSQRVGQETARALTKREIDRRIQQLTSHLAVGMEGAIDEARSPGATDPRWIAPAELVRRMRQYVVYN